LFDMDAFVDVVDALGGVDVHVEKDLYDSLYPGPNFTYQTFSIQAGDHHMDGLMALKYARSRKSTTDFDRAKRQQNIIDAVRAKFEAIDFVKNADQVIDIYNTVSDSIETDVDLLSFLSYLNSYRDFEIDRGHVLSTSNFLYSTYNVSGAYILLPKNEDYSEIQAYIKKVVLE